MVRQQEPVVTGDAVVLDVQIAQLPVRALSALIDVTVVFIAYIIGVLLWATTLTQFDPALSAAVLIIFTVVTIVGYPIAFETATRGRSLGKMALGLRVVSDDGGPERFRQALFRALAGVIEIWMFTGGPAVICSLLSPKGKRIGDMFAGTVVISERAPRLTPPPPMPPRWRGGHPRCSCPGSAPSKPSWPANFSPAQRNWILGCGIRWPTGSPATSSHRYRHLRRRAFRRNWSLRRCWPNGTAANWPGCSRRRRDRRRSGPGSSRCTSSPLPRHRRRSSRIPGDSSRRSSGSARRSA